MARPPSTRLQLRRTSGGFTPRTRPAPTFVETVEPGGGSPAPAKRWSNARAAVAGLGVRGGGAQGAGHVRDASGLSRPDHGVNPFGGYESPSWTRGGPTGTRPWPERKSPDLARAGAELVGFDHDV